MSEPASENEQFYAIAQSAGLTYKQAELMREQVRQAVLAERERCARVCDAQCEVYGIKMDQTDRERQEERWDRLHAYQEAVENIAAAIRRG